MECQNEHVEWADEVWSPVGTTRCPALIKQVAARFLAIGGGHSEGGRPGREAVAGQLTMFCWTGGGWLWWWGFKMEGQLVGKTEKVQRAEQLSLSMGRGTASRPIRSWLAALSGNDSSS